MNNRTKSVGSKAKEYGKYFGNVLGRCGHPEIVRALDLDDARLGSYSSTKISSRERV